ncbi:hypothetical protein GCM10018966_068420 [Streptomyces yanii]
MRTLAAVKRPAAAGIEDPVVFEEDPGTSSRLHPLQRPKFGGAFRRQAADAAADHADAAGTARDTGPAIKVEGMPACVAKQVSRPVRNREAPAAAQPLA